MKVFISYAREDIEIARKLRDDLEKAGIKTWLDKEDLLPGQKWRDVISREIRESSYFIALLSSGSLSKHGFVQSELKKALDALKEFPSDQIFVIPVRIDDCKPQDEQLQNLHWADLFPSYENGLNKILRALGKETQVKKTFRIPRWMIALISVLLIAGLIYVTSQYSNIFSKLKKNPPPIVEVKQYQSTEQPLKQTIQTDEKRIALVIGNSAYKHHLVKNAVNDANDVATTLKSLDFEVMLKVNAERQDMIEVIRAFRQQLQKMYIGLFYFSGQGVSINGKDYLIPIETSEIKTESDIKDQAVPLEMILDEIKDAGNLFNIFILDACRNNPLFSTHRGLARIIPKGMLIAYATSPGSVAWDGDGKNSPYTKYLLKYMVVPDLPIEVLFQKVRLDVIQETNNNQIPMESSSMTGTFYFVRNDNKR